MTDPTVLLRTPMHGWHVGAGAKMADFGGFDMPIEYPASGVLKEHAAVRTTAGLFDVSHLGKVRVTGPSATGFLNSVLTNDLQKIEAGQAQYTLLCEEDSGGVVDDLIAYVFADDDVLLIPNAANSADVVHELTKRAGPQYDIHDQHRDLGVIAVQGPRSAEVLGTLGLPTDNPYMSFTVADHAGSPVIVCRSGYTGEHGYELLPRWDDAEALWEALAEAVGDVGGVPAGLGARDTLRTEMGYPLHGQDLSRSITPVQARLGWAVGWDKLEFAGRAALVAERAAGPSRVLRGLLATGRGIPRPHMLVTGGTGDVIGEVTSGTFSPTLRRGIALALLDSTVPEGQEVTVDVRGRASAMSVVRPPFVKPSVAG